MNQHTLIKNIQAKFNVNHIYVRSILSFLDLSCEEDLKMLSFEKILKEKPTPFIKWVGGKRQLLKQFRELGLYPPDNFDPCKSTYFEPFVGGGAVFLDLSPQKAVLSDMNYELITAYNIIKDNVGGLIKSLKKHKNTKEYFLKMRAKNINRLSDIEIASRFIYLNKTCFNGLYRVNKKGGFNTPFGSYNNPLICDEENLRKISKKLKNVKVLHKDYKEVVKKAKKGDFIYFDPPYAPLSPTASFTSYTKEGFGEHQQIELRDTFYKLHKKGCFVMLSNSNSDFINKIYKELAKKDKKIKINKVGANRMINSDATKRGKIKEVLVINY
jgi:DNA adenine methylase